MYFIVIGHRTTEGKTEILRVKNNFFYSNAHGNSEIIIFVTEPKTIRNKNLSINVFYNMLISQERKPRKFQRHIPHVLFLNSTIFDILTSLLFFQIRKSVYISMETELFLKVLGTLPPF